MTKERKIFTDVNEKGEQVVLTKKQILERLLAEPTIAENELYTDFIKHEIELLNRKGSTKGSKTNTENIELAEKLYDLLARSGAETTIAEILQTSEFPLGKFTSSKIVALLKILQNDNRVERIENKRKVYFKAII